MPRVNIPSEETIVGHFKKLMSSDPLAEGPPRHGFPGQRADRENEQIIRGHVVITSQRLVEQGWPKSKVAELLHVPDRTLRDWSVPASTPLVVLPLGRPVQLAPAAERNRIISRIDELGPNASQVNCVPESVTRYLGEAPTVAISRPRNCRTGREVGSCLKTAQPRARRE